MEGRQNQRCAGQYGQRAHPAGPAARGPRTLPYGLRALSRRHADQPFTLHLAGARYAVDYEPITGLFGGNSNWRGRIWFPVSYLVIEALHTYARFFGDDILIEHPAGSGRRVTLTVLADDLARRLVSIVLDEENGRRPVFGDARPLPDPPGLAQPAALPEYFHGDTGRGVGACHQTGWTALVAGLVLRTADHGATGNRHDWLPGTRRVLYGITAETSSCRTSTGACRVSSPADAARHRPRA